MSDLIDRQAAIDVLSRISNMNMCAKNYIMVKDMLKALPTAQPEIIRCKDCKHWGIHKWLNIPWCREMHIDRGAEDFCSNAERRTDDN